jgi:HAMP domain-containing protein
MRAIQRQLDLTYLYTELVTERTQITYGVDGTQGEKHSPLHSADLLPEDEVDGVRDVLLHGTTYVSDIKDWPPWGLIKSALAPILDSTGRTIAVVGADVDISLIHAKSRRAFLTVFAISGLALLVAAGLSLPLSLRLVRPLAQIKAAALEAATGRFDRPLEIAHPAELRDLARAFDQMRITLDQDLQAARASTQEVLIRRHRRELIRQLEACDSLSRAPGDSRRIAVHAPAATASGAVRSGAFAWLWIAAPPGDEPLKALRIRSDLARALQPRIDQAGGFAGGFAEELQCWVGREVCAAVLLAETASDLELRCCGSLPALAVCGDQVVALDLSRRHTGPFDAIVLGPDADFLRTAVAPLLGAAATHGVPAAASALLALLQPAWAAAPIAPTLLVLTQVAYLSPA